MKNGERQVANSVDEIRRDHLARYEWVSKNLAEGSVLIDIACGVGYGTNILASAGHKVLGLDKDQGALEYAVKNWSHPNAEFGQVDAEKLNGSIGNFDAAVCFETIEHVKDPAPLLRCLRESANILICSVPNEDVLPFMDENGVTTEFHHRHYTKAQFEMLLNANGWNVVEWSGQMGPHSEVEVDRVDGRTLIAVCSHRQPLPDHVVILGLGPSLDEYTNIVKRAGNRKAYADETWTINMLGNVFDCDLCFHMDDVRIQEIRAKARPDSNIAYMLEWLRESKVPVMTSRSHPDYPALQNFPLEEVLQEFKHPYFNSTAAYAVAYAMYIGVKKISIFGCDYTYPGAHDAEKGRACLEFWLGMAANRGIKLSVPKKSTLLDAIYPDADRLYGFDTLDVNLQLIDNKISVEFTEKAVLPTAEEIEARYDHSAHPNKLVEEGDK